MTAEHRPAEMNPAAWRALFEGSQMLRTSLEQDLRRSVDMSHSDYNIMLLLVESQAPMCMGELAQHLVFPPSRLTYAIKSLVERGLVLQVPDANDRRRQIVQPTEQGRALFLQARTTQRAALKTRLLDVVSDEEFLHMAQIFERVRARITEVDGLASEEPDCAEAHVPATSAGESSH